MKLQCGDIVVRISYNKDICFKVVEIDNELQTAQLKGLEMRLIADAPIDDLEKLGAGELASYRARELRLRLEKVKKKQTLSRNRDKKRSYSDKYQNIPGRILHIDGDSEYLDVCRQAYRDLHLPVCCYYVPEQNQPEVVLDLLDKCKPEILVLTGHDSVNKQVGKSNNPEHYRNSKYFIEAVRRARRYQSSKDNLVIFAGACQSWYRGLMDAGANFASSPGGILIHCLDPVLVVEKVANTPIQKTIDIYAVLSESITGPQGVGGIETRGQYRIGLPKEKK